MNQTLLIFRWNKWRAAWVPIRAVAFMFCLSVPALAENKAAAQVLFNAARDAMDSGDYALACGKFEESNRLDPAPGTLLNLGNCEEKRGRFASAWHRYTEAINMLEEDDRRYTFAQEKAAALESRVPRLTIELEEGAPPEAEVRLNRETVQEFGVPTRLDPGDYTIVVEAEGYESTTEGVTLAEGDRAAVTVGVGDAIEKPSIAAPPPPAEKPAPAESSSRTLGYVFGGAGVVTGLTAISFGVLTYQKYLVAKEHCDLDRDECFNDTGQTAADTGGNYEIISYALGAVSIASLSIGAYLLLSDEGPEETALHVGSFDGMQGLRVEGTF